MDPGSALVREAHLDRPDEERLLRELVEQVPDGLSVWTEDARLIVCNRAALRLFGVPDERARRGVAIEDVMPATFASRARERIRECAALKVEITPSDYRHDDGRVFEARCIPFELDGAPAVISLARDVGERRQVEARMMLADRMASIGMLASGLSHELNNPLAWVLANLRFLEQVLESSPEVGADAREALADAAEGARRIETVVRDLQLLSRSNEESQAIELRPVTEAALQMAGPELRRHAQVSVRFEEAPRVMANAAGLGQAFLNLLMNAWQAIPEGAPETSHRIEVRVGTGEDGWAEWSVSDTGSGMTETVRRRIFDPFFTTKPVGVGTGLGLTVSHALVTRMGGTILCSSEPGRGTTFTLRFPPAPRG